MADIHSQCIRSQSIVPSINDSHIATAITAAFEMRQLGAPHKKEQATENRE